MDKIYKDNQKKEFLNKYLEYVQCEETILQKIQEIRINQSCPSVINDGMPHGTDKSDLSSFAAQIDVQIEKLKSVRKQENSARRSILAKIKGIDDKDERIMLRLRYIQGLSIDDAAVILGVCRAKGYNIHNSAIKNLKL